MKLLATLGDYGGQGGGRIVVVEPTLERAEEVFRYEPPKALVVSEKGLTGACHIDDEYLAVCSFNAVHRVNKKRWVLDGTLHQPCFNDLHHVACYKNRLWISNTGLDRVDVFDLEGRFLSGHELSPAWWNAGRLTGAWPSREAWLEACSPGWRLSSQKSLPIESVDTEYYRASQDLPFHQRKVRDFVHPNHVCAGPHGAWVTCFQSCSLRSLLDGEVLISNIPGYPHDGVWADDAFWFTCTNGLVLSYSRPGPDTKIAQRIDIFQASGRFGWCRGLYINRELLIVGVSKIQKMPRYRWREDIPFEQTETSVLILERSTGEFLARVDLSPFGQSPKLYSILPFQEDS